MHKLIAALVAAIALAAAEGTATGATVVVPAERDTYVDAKRPDRDRDRGKRLKAGGRPARIALLRFDVTGTQGRVLTRAVLKLRVRDRKAHV